MSETYQAIYDAIRDTDAGTMLVQLATKYEAPSVLYRPRLSIDGDQWCALYREDLQAGVAGFGNTPAAAMEDFNRAWREDRPQVASREAPALAVDFSRSSPHEDSLMPTGSSQGANER